MPRNFYRRVEVMFPIESPALRKRILNEILPAYLKDNCRARLLKSDGTYVRLAPEKGVAPYRCQEQLLDITMSEATSRSPFPSNGSTTGLPQLVGAEEER